MENMIIYESLRMPPREALKTIDGGRLSGMSSINPMWRIKALTEQFGTVGFGWRYTIDRQWLEPGANDEVKAFVQISLYIKVDGEWSEAIPGIGGNSFVAKERNGLYVSDECYKMAFTDALSVACKSLGMAGDVYWKEDEDKYTTPKTDFTFHDIMVVKKRVEEKMTKAIQRQIAMRDVCARVGTRGLSDKQLETALKAMDVIAAFEQELDKFLHA